MTYSDGPRPQAPIPAAPSDVAGRLQLIVSELQGLPHVVETCREAAALIESLSHDREVMRDCLLGIALSDRYRRYPKQHEDGGVRGQSGLRAIRALTGKHGSYLNDDEVVQLDKDARAALASLKGGT